MRENWSFAPSELDHFPLTHGLRRGLHSCAASRRGIAGRVPLQIRESSSHADNPESHSAIALAVMVSNLNHKRHQQ